MTPQLQQAIKLLQLSRVELSDLVRGELMENPLLEEAQEIGTTVEEPVSSVELQDAVDQPNEAAPEPSSPAEPLQADAVPKDSVDWEAYSDSTPFQPATGGGEGEEQPSFEATLTRAETLPEYLLCRRATCRTVRPCRSRASSATRR
jgi:RNA polymerase sigma-54 factor